MSKPESVSWPTHIRKITTRFFVRSFHRYKHLHPAGKVVVWVFLLVNVAIASLFISLGPKRLAQGLYDLSQKLANHPYGWLMLGSVMVVTSFPPLIGYSTCVSLCGFAYGLKGFFLAAPGTLIGAGVAFVVLRLVFGRKLRKWTSRNEKWQALESVVKAKGLPLVILIRASPFPPWVYANAWLASIETVKLWQFLVATVFVLPKIFLTVFIGSRIAAFSDGEQREHMDKTTAILNAVSIAISILLALSMSFIVFRLVQKKVAEMQASSDINEELAAEAIEEGEEGAPLLMNFSDESLLENSRPKGASEV